jgi:hypothetical protein
MSSLKTVYQRTLAASRKIGEAFRSATKSFKGREGLSEKLSQLDPDDLPEDQHKHHPGFVGAILEFAASHQRPSDGSGASPDDKKEVDRADVRAFATHFINKRPEYSRTKNGVAAAQMEGWLIKSSGHLFERFVETVLEKGNKYIAIFEGKLNKEEVRRFRAGIAGFTTFEHLIEAGEHNGEETFEFTILDCTATGQAAAKAKEPELKRGDANDGEKNGDAKLPGVKQSMESLLPTSRDEYDAVCEQGGLSGAALCVVAGDDIFETQVDIADGSRVQDPNGVVWLSEDGQTWVPDAETVEEAYVVPDQSQRPRNYRLVGDGEPARGACATCRYYRENDEDYFCELYEYGVGSEMTCDSWEARQEGLAEDEQDDATHEVVLSDYGAWGVVQEDEHTIVSVRESAWMVPHPYDEVIEGIVALGEMYEEMPAERDLMVEAYLRDYASECGVLCAVPEVVEAATGYVEERDALVEDNNQERLAEVSEDDRDELLEHAGELVDEQYPDVEQGGEQWHQLRMGVFGSLSRELVERQKTDPALGSGKHDGDAPGRMGAFKVSSRALRLFSQIPDFKGPQDTLFKRGKNIITDIPRTDLPKFFGLNGGDAGDIPDAQDIVARQPKKAFQIFLRRVARVHPKLHMYMQKVPSNVPIIFHMIVTQLSGEMMANLIFKRYFATDSSHPEAVKREGGRNKAADKRGSIQTRKELAQYAAAKEARRKSSVGVTDFGEADDEDDGGDGKKA